MALTLTAITRSQSRFAELNDRGTADDARIVKQNVNATEFRDGAVEPRAGSRRRGSRRQVRKWRVRRLGYFGGNLLSGCLVKVGDSHRRTFARKQESRRATDAGGGAGDQGNFAASS